MRRPIGAVRLLAGWSLAPTVALAVALVVGIAAPIAAAQEVQPAPGIPTEVDGQINGMPARFVADSANVLLSTVEADRLGLDYRQGKPLSIGSVKLWMVTLNSVTVDKRTRLTAPAGVVESIPAYFEALRNRPSEATSQSRMIQVQIAGQLVQAYDLGLAGALLLPIEQADRIGLKYRQGKPATVPGLDAWLLQAPVTIAGRQTEAMLLVAEPEAYFRAVDAEMKKRR